MLVAHEAWRVHEALIDGPDAERLDRRVLRRLREGRALPAAGYAALQEARPRVQAAFAEELGDALLLTPAAPHVAPEIAPLEADDDLFLAVNATTLRITMPTSFLDAPGVALPIGPAEAGLPASLLISGASGGTTGCSRRPSRSRPSSAEPIAPSASTIEADGAPGSGQEEIHVAELVPPIAVLDRRT